MEQNEYFNDLAKIKETIIENRNKAMVVVNSAMIITYYQIGTIINKRKEWGNKFIQKLADDLKDYGKGYSYEQLKKMSQFVHFFSENEIRSQPVTQIPWSTLSRVIIQNPLEILPEYIKRKVPYVRTIHTSETKRNYDYGSWVDFIEVEEIK